jgi:membrane protease YdiL (CAAX protease family)
MGFLVAWLMMPLIIFLTVCINLLFPNVSYNPEMTGFIDRFKDILTPDQIEQMKISLGSLPINIIWLTLIQGLIAGISINAIAAFGEELGWRGFLVHAFKNMHFVKASLLIGLIWGFWHAPMILMGHNYPQHPQVGILMMTILCILLTPILIYITLKSKSVIAAAITHGTMNAVAGISIIAIKGGNDLTSGIAGLAGFLALIVCIFVLFMLDYFITKDKIFLNKINQHFI